MGSIEYGKLLKKLKKALDAERFEHTLGVAGTAVSLAMRYEYDLGKARTAGLLHDCAKCVPLKKAIALCEQYRIKMTPMEREHPYLLHGKLGAVFAMKKYGVQDKDVISAIIYHTTGRPDMTLLEKIIYVADYIEPLRERAEHLPKLRKLAFVDIDQAVHGILKDTLGYLEESGKPVDVLSRKAMRFYGKKMALFCAEKR